MGTAYGSLNYQTVSLTGRSVYCTFISHITSSIYLFHFNNLKNIASFYVHHLKSDGYYPILIRYLYNYIMYFTNIHNKNKKLYLFIQIELTYVFGSDLLSQTVSRQVPSALRGLTSVFGMGTGVSLSLLPPDY